MVVVVALMVGKEGGCGDGNDVGNLNEWWSGGDDIGC